MPLWTKLVVSSLMLLLLLVASSCLLISRRTPTIVGALNLVRAWATVWLFKSGMAISLALSLALAKSGFQWPQPPSELLIMALIGVLIVALESSFVGAWFGPRPHNSGS